jgi:hypothetical protein
LAIVASGCAMAPSKGPESDALLDGKADAVNGVLEHTSPIQEIHEIGVSLTEEVRGHAFNFTLGMDEHVSIHTALFSGDRGPEIDTVLYLFRKNDDGWGHYIRRNDDDASRDGTVWSRIEEDLGPGEYRILAKAYDDAVGMFAVNMNCADGFCDYYDPADVPEPTEPGTGTADPVGTGAVSIVVPLLDENENLPMSRFNDELERAGLPMFPDTLTVSSEDGDFQAELDALAEQSARDDVLAITGAELSLYYSSLEPLLDAGFCYSGDGSAVPDLMSGIAGSILSEMFVVWGWRAGEKSAYDEWHEPTRESAIYDEWNEYDPSGGSVLLVASSDDDGTEGVVIVPACR